MSRPDKPSHDPSAIEAVLKGLTNRPNVLYTLILSRKDGSIINASGFRGNVQNETSDLQTQNSIVAGGNLKQQDTDQDRGQKLNTAANSQPSTAPEILASAVYKFVTASVGLATSLASIDTMGELYNTQQLEGSDQQPKNAVEPSSDKVVAAQDVQLLRMRTKKQEIIIFPDPNYLCCVVQALGNNNT